MGVPYSPIDCFNIFIAQSAAEVFFFFALPRLGVFLFRRLGKIVEPRETPSAGVGACFFVYSFAIIMEKK